MEESSDVIELAKIALADELFAVKIYSMAARIVRERSTRDRLLRISEMEKGHAEFWKLFLKNRGFDLTKVKVSSLKTAFYALFLRIFGLAFTFRLMESGEREAVELYSRMLEDPNISEAEKAEIKKILEDELIHEQELAEEGSRFEKFLDHVRDAVLGMNDGLVEILSVTAGLAGAYGSTFYVALSGLVVAIAGALSMGIGAFVAARAQRQVHEGTLSRILLAARYAAHVFKERIRNFMEDKGYSSEASLKVADESMKDPKLMARIISEEEYGLREEKLENPAVAGLYTGLAYLLSSFLPNFTILHGAAHNVSSISLTSTRRTRLIHHRVPDSNLRRSADQEEDLGNGFSGIRIGGRNLHNGKAILDIVRNNGNLNFRSEVDDLSNNLPRRLSMR